MSDAQLNANSDVIVVGRVLRVAAWEKAMVARNVPDTFTASLEVLGVTKGNVTPGDVLPVAWTDTNRYHPHFEGRCIYVEPYYPGEEVKTHLRKVDEFYETVYASNAKSIIRPAPTKRLPTKFGQVLGTDGSDSEPPPAPSPTAPSAPGQILGAEGTLGEVVAESTTRSREYFPTGQLFLAAGGSAILLALLVGYLVFRFRKGPA
jgi:hypothetical protein